MKKKVELTEAQVQTLSYAINWYLDAVEDSDGVKREVKSLEIVLEKLGTVRQSV